MHLMAGGEDLAELKEEINSNEKAVGNNMHN